MDTLTLNGQVQQHPLPCTLAELLAQQGIGPERSGIAVALNERVVPRQQWPLVQVMPGDRLEVVTARQGG